MDDHALELINGELELARWGLDPGRPLQASEERALASLRDLLGRLAETVAAGHELDADELAALNAVIGRTPVRARLERGGEGRYVLELTPVAESWEERAVRELAGSFGSVLRRAPNRLKLCENPDCRRAFFDRTRSRTRRWCESGGCGNRLRVRRYRERARKSRTTSR
jgi:predicted RNA-binding Zn ribbon-like protein